VQVLGRNGRIVLADDMWESILYCNCSTRPQFIAADLATPFWKQSGCLASVEATYVKARLTRYVHLPLPTCRLFDGVTKNSSEHSQRSHLPIGIHGKVRHDLIHCIRVICGLTRPSLLAS
jgi:hypothetical protein